MRNKYLRYIILFILMVTITEIYSYAEITTITYKGNVLEKRSAGEGYIVFGNLKS